MHWGTPTTTPYEQRSEGVYSPETELVSIQSEERMVGGSTASNQCIDGRPSPTAVPPGDVR